MTPKISVIIPVYNTEKYLDQCIQSVLNQTFTDFELLLINDGSKDSSGEICDAYADKDQRIQVFHQENKGVSAARNLGIEKAKGEWITFVDSDDCVGSAFLKSFNVGDNEDRVDLYIQGYIKSFREKDYQENKITESSRFYPTLYPIIEELEIETLILEVPWAKLFKKEIIINQNCLFNEKLSNGEDHLFVIEYLKFIKSIFVNSHEEYYYNFDNSNSLSKKYIEHNTLYLYNSLIYQARLNNIKTHALSEEYRKFTENNHYDLLHKSLVKLFEKDSQISTNEKYLYINKYLKEIDFSSKIYKFKTVKTGLLIRLIWRSYLPYKMKILTKIFG